MRRKSPTFAEIREILDRVARRQEEVAESQKETDGLLKRLEKRQEETDRQLKETDRRLKETDRQLRTVGKQIGQLTDGWGKFVEGLVAPSIPKLFRKLGIEVSTIHQRSTKTVGEEELEIDVLAIGTRNGKEEEEVIIATQVQSNLTMERVRWAIGCFGRFFKFFKEYKGRAMIGAVAGIRLQSGVKEYAERRGLYVLAPSGDQMRILNKKGFKPKMWMWK